MMYTGKCSIDDKDNIVARVDEDNDLEINLFNRFNGVDIEVYLPEEEALKLANMIIDSYKK